MKKKQETLMILSPQGHQVNITFEDYMAYCYSESQEKKNRLSFDKYKLIKKQALTEGWRGLLVETDKQVAKNNQIHRKAYLKLKYAVKTLWVRLCLIFKAKQG